jgi:hypothetical protein
MAVTAKDLEKVVKSYEKLVKPATEAQTRMQKAAEAAKQEGQRIRSEKELLGR